MKTEIEDYGYVVMRFSTVDLCKMIELFEPDANDDYLKLFKSMSKGFAEWPVSVRQEVVNTLLRQHLSKKEAGKVIEYMEVLAGDIWK